ncbi:MAG: hypothetical protein QF628_04785 [Acidimicrobiales bacterium]|nr:hypothetical protein [Acidimicrobiales bacterium]MDP7117572.1 hypothetical protein [Acidimicrobiales bacterium]MDP7411111.1 hypothetical protein [Acidimicrobiales bacterium]MEE1522987.1 hypothetical protein [Acidimicrobiales bacterium]
MIDLDPATVLLQWAVGGLFLLWVTARRREVGVGYGWTMRITFGLMAVGSLVVGLMFNTVLVREVATAGVVVATVVAFVVSVLRRRAGVAGQRVVEEQRSTRVAEMTGIDVDVREKARRFDPDVPEFPPILDLVAPVVGLVALLAAGIDAGDPALLSVARTLVGALFLGAVSDAMLLGHWYLVQPGLARGPLVELVWWTGLAWPFELAVLLWPTGMVSVLNGTIDDGYNGLLGWFWAACAVSTIVLVGLTRAALRERQYSAVMAATGLLYLAILTAFGMDLVARAVLV